MTRPDASDQISSVLQTLRALKELHNMASAEVQDTENVELDIIHDLELNPLSYHEVARRGKRLTETLRSRRIAKDTVELLQPFMRWCDASPGFFKSLEGVLGDTRKIEEKHKNRYYRPRATKEGV